MSPGQAGRQRLDDGEWNSEGVTAAFSFFCCCCFIIIILLCSALQQFNCCSSSFTPSGCDCLVGQLHSTLRVDTGHYSMEGSEDEKINFSSSSIRRCRLILSLFVPLLLCSRFAISIRTRVMISALCVVDCRIYSDSFFSVCLC